MSSFDASEALRLWPTQEAKSSAREKEMRDGKLLGDEGLASGQTVFAVQPTKPTAWRANLWAIIGFCAAALICSLVVASYLHPEQMPTLLAEAPLS
jgi:hypothetical protein